VVHIDLRILFLPQGQGLFYNPSIFRQQYDYVQYQSRRFITEPSDKSVQIIIVCSASQPSKTSQTYSRSGEQDHGRVEQIGKEW
jgi:hypothetical protein